VAFSEELAGTDREGLGGLVGRTPESGKCVHCLCEPVLLTSDHVFPRAWYPDATRPDVLKWQVPACRDCNSAYRRLEQDLLLRLGLCINPVAAATSGIVTKVLRLLDPRYAKNEKDRRARQAKKDKILRGNQIPRSAIYPGFGGKWNRPPELQQAITIPANSIRRLTEKIVRGIFWLEDDKFLDPPYRVTFYPMEDAQAAPFAALLDKHGKTSAHEPGIIVRRAVAIEDNTSSIFNIEICSTFKMYAVVDVPER